MNVKTLYKEWLDTLTPLTGADEARAVSREAFEGIAGMTPVDIALKGDEELSASTQQRLEDALRRVGHNGEPVQYVTGRAWFHGLQLTVNPSVLIPRRETSQLVDIIEKDYEGRDDMAVIDLCTGSGAIALALSRALRFSRVTAVDLSHEALEVARLNGRQLKCRIEWVEADVLDPDALPGNSYDIVVSNPPYIPMAEKNEVEPSVYRYEPHMALMVTDEEPLAFYEAIAGWARGHLNESGRVYFEINPHFASQLKGMMHEKGFTEVDVLKDLYGRDRFIRAAL